MLLEAHSIAAQSIQLYAGLGLLRRKETRQSPGCGSDGSNSWEGLANAKTVPMMPSSVLQALE